MSIPSGVTPDSATPARTEPIDPHSPTRPHRVGGRLADLVDAGVLHAADVHVARTLLAHAPLPRTGEDDAASADVTSDVGDDPVALAIALATRAVRHSSVLVDLATLGETVAPDEDTGLTATDLAWPPLAGWLAALHASPLVAQGEDDERRRPVRLLGSEVTLDRYWRQERAVTAWFDARATAPPPVVDEERLRAGLDRLFHEPAPDLQRLAAATAVLSPVSVVAGGPGTGKTRTVARILALLHDQPTSDGRPLRVALTAPSGKAAARLTDALHDQLDTLGLDPATRAALAETSATTMHRLLGFRGDNRNRFRHHAGNPLSHHVVVVDETSMVSLTMMTRLVDALPPDCRLVLVGDPRQLASVEAGAVLGDVVGPAALGTTARPAARARLATVTGHELPAPRPGATPTGPLAEGIVVLSTVYRFAGGISALAGALERGDADEVVALLAEPGHDDVTWVETAVDDVGAVAAEPVVVDALVEGAVGVVRAARDGDAPGALAGLSAAQLLCVHRRGPAGVQRWGRLLERAVRDRSGGLPWGWFPGRPVLVTANDATLGLYNGDSGVVVDDGRDLRCAFSTPAGPRLVSPTRLRHVETHYAMTVHKAQGSQFGHVVALLPRPSSPLLTRELLYTAVTRAEQRVTVVGSEAAVRAAVERPIQRATGLGRRLWHAGP